MTEKEWLNRNQLSLDIWNKKYRNEDESFEEFLDRVCVGQKDIKELIRSKKFIFGGRILANRGIKGKKGSLSNCFLSGTKVLTKNGYKNIEDINVGEYVYSHTNSWSIVNKVMSRPYKGIIYKIISSNLLNPIFCTPNHKFLTTNGDWKSIEDFIIKSNGHNKIDRLVSSNELIYYNYEESTIDIIKDFICPINRRLYFEDDLVGIEEFVNNGHKEVWRSPRNYINRYFILDEEMLYVIGRWLGDGSITKRTSKTNPSIFQIVFNAKNEKEHCNKCFDILKSHFPTLNITIRETSQNVLALRIENEIFSSWFENNFGHGCSEKYIPKWIGYPRNLLLGLLDADGSVHKDGNFKLLLKNPELIYWARQALFHFGINTSQIKSETRQIADYFTIFKNQNRKLLPFLSKTYEDDRMNYNLALDCNSVKIDDLEILEDCDTIVYNLSVEKDHSYMVNGVFVHNCYVLPAPEDNLESILECAKQMARTFSYGGGVGIDLSNLRPRGATTHNAAKESTGPVSFMDLYSQVTQTISQSGRRGATMISLSVNHPDIEEFIDCKTDLERVKYANISVRVTDGFMEAVEHGITKYMLTWPCDKREDIYISDWKEGELHEVNGVYYKIVNPIKLFRKLAENNWNYAEPGILYWNRIEEYNMLDNIEEFKYAGVNP